MSRLSILIPWCESTAAFESTLVSILANRPDNSEVIVVHRGTYDDPYELRREVLFVEHEADATVGDLLNRGLDVAGGEVLHVVACGVSVADGWSDGARERLSRTTLGSVTPLVVNAARPQRLVNSGVALNGAGVRTTVGQGRACDRPSVSWGPSRLAGFYRISAVRDVGGFADAVGDLWDVDVAASLRDAGYETELALHCRLAYDPAQLDDAVVDPTEAATWAERLFWRHAPSLGWSGWLRHGFQVAAGSVVSLCTGGGVSALRARLSAALDRAAYRDHREQISLASERCGLDSPPILSIEQERRRRSGGSMSQRRAA